MRLRQLILINVYFLGLTALSQTLTPLALPLLIQKFLGEANQATFFGNLRLWTLMLALLIQSLMGLLSDHSTSQWGKRKPFIFIGTLGSLILLILIGFSAQLSGFQGYWVLFALMLLIMVATNTSQGALQGFIPDLVPINQRGLASGIKALFEVPLPLILVALTIGPLIANGQLWSALIILVVVLSFVMFLTMFVKEQQPSQNFASINWQPFLQLVIMTILFSLAIFSVGLFIKYVATALGVNLNLRYSILVFGIFGLVAMLVTIGLGVILSIRIGIGKQESKRNPSFKWWVINRLAFLAGSTNLASFAIFYIQGRLNYSQEEAAGPASILLLIVGVLIILTAIPSGWISDKIGFKPVLFTSGILAALGAFIVISTNLLLIVYLGALLVGIGTGIFYTSNWALGTRIVPQKASGKYLGISNLAGAGAGAVGAFIGGPIADFFTSAYPQSDGIGYVVLFAIYGCLFIFSIFTLRFIQIKY